jgi:hypothetical protein
MASGHGEEDINRNAYVKDQVAGSKVKIGLSDFAPALCYDCHFLLLYCFVYIIDLPDAESIVFSFVLFWFI